MDCWWEVTKRGGVPIVVCHGEIDSASCEPLRDFINSIAETFGYRVIVDLTDVPYIASGPLGMLVGVAGVLRGHDGMLASVCSRGHVSRLIHLMGLDSALLLCQDMPTAYDCIMETGHFMSG